MASSSGSAGSRPRVLFACHLDWGSAAQVGSHQLARGFVAAGWDVAYISNALSPVQILRDPAGFRARARAYRRNGVEALYGHLWAYTPAAILTPHNAPVLRSRWLHRHWHRLTVPPVVGTVRHRGFGEVDLLYIESPGQAFWLNSITYRRSVMRVMDRMSGFRRYAPEMRSLEESVAQSVDLVGYSARSLESDVLALRPKRAIHLPNGVNFRHFADGTRVPPRELAAISRPIAIYVGAMDHWFDFDAVNQMTQSLPELSFVLIGPDAMAQARLTPRPNLHLLGPRPYADLPAYLHNSEVALIPFDATGSPELVNAIHPLKLYEYLASGLPVVAADWEELRLLDSPAVLGRSASDQINAIRQVLRDPPDPSVGIRFAEAADWGRQVERLSSELFP